MTNCLLGWKENGNVPYCSIELNIIKIYRWDLFKKWIIFFFFTHHWNSATEVTNSFLISTFDKMRKTCFEEFECLKIAYLHHLANKLRTFFFTAHISFRKFRKIFTVCWEAVGFPVRNILISKMDSFKQDFKLDYLKRDKARVQFW